jgi:hypothetical protein
MSNNGPKVNGYAYHCGMAFFDAIPKAVWAALAVSYASNGGELEGTNTARKLVTEWRILNKNKIVPQEAPNNTKLLNLLHLDEFPSDPDDISEANSRGYYLDTALI